MTETTVNGDLPQSAVFDHIKGYPIVSDSFSTFKSYPLGQKSIDLTNDAYARLVKPTLPYFEKPASYVKPYAAKADEIGDNLLTKFDEKVPIVKSETKEIKTTVIDYVHWPMKVAGEQRDYVINTYTGEYKKCGGDGVVAGGKALVSGSFVITSDWLAYFASLLQRKKEEVKAAAQETAETVKEKTSD